SLPSGSEQSLYQSHCALDAQFLRESQLVRVCDSRSIETPQMHDVPEWSRLLCDRFAEQPRQCLRRPRNLLAVRRANAALAERLELAAQLSSDTALIAQNQPGR